jgi:hypothetical protein
MRRPILLLALLLAAVPLRAQDGPRGDQARLTFGIGLGYNGSADLWAIDNQVLLDDDKVDSAYFARGVRPSIGITFLGTYFPSQSFGIVGEIHLLGLAYEDTCTMRTNSGSGINQAICQDIQGTSSPGTAVVATLGGIYRPFPWTDIQPYLRADVGLLLSQQSAIRMRGTYVDPATDSLVDYFVFQDNEPSSIRPAFGLAGGLTAFVSKSYQVRLEGKDNLVYVEQVAGTVPVPSAEPPTTTSLRHIFSLTIAIEVVLEKKRGRRY